MVTLGRNPSGKNIEMDPFDPAHSVISGRTRSGKTVQVYGMLSQLRDYPVRVCGVDPSGVLFNALGNGLGGDAWRVMTLNDPARVDQVMSEIVAEMQSRIELLLSRHVDKFEKEDFSGEFPLLIVLMEEYPGTLSVLAAVDAASGAKVGERLEPKLRARIQRLALEGAKVGVRLWVVSQRADASLLSGVLRSQLTTRLSFAQDDDGLRMLHEGITPEEIQLAQRFVPGQAFAEMAGVLPRTAYRADLIDYAELVAVMSDRLGGAVSSAMMPRATWTTPSRPQT